jgi:hypothetical protein
LLQTGLAGLLHTVFAQQQFGSEDCGSPSRDCPSLGETLGENSLEIMMPIPVHRDDVRINRIHSAAVCEEIGERLSVALGTQSVELPDSLLALIEHLAKVDHAKRP